MNKFLKLFLPKIWVLAILLVVGFAFSTTTWGQLLLEENFDYPAGDSLNVLHGWVVQPTASYVNTIKVVSPGLTYANYPSVVGNGVMVDTTGQDIYRTFTSDTLGSKYASFLVNITKATTAGDYFFHFTQSAGSTTFRGRVFAKLSGSDIVFGLLKGSTGTAAYTTTTYAMNTTHLVVLKYTFNTGSATNDSVYLFINPPIGAVEPIPDLRYGSTDADFTSFGVINLRQGAVDNAPRLTLDGIRVGTSWSQIFPTFNVTFKLNTSTRNDTIVPTSMVQIRGNTSPLTWGNDSPLMTNIGGDYWELTHSFPQGANLAFKFFATNWEGGGDKNLTVTKDTVLPLFYFDRGHNPPFTPTDSVDVWFRVNVAGVVGFDPATQQVGIRGSLSPFGWDASYFLNREGTSMFYSGVAKFHPDSARNVYYKYYIDGPGGAGWEPSGDNMFPMKNDTTIVWKWFGGLRPTDKPITEKNITFQADIAALINSGGFNTATDSLKILIFAGGAITGGTQKMVEDLFTAGLFTTTLTIKAALDSEIKYKFKAYPDERFENGGGYETGSDRIYVWTGQDSVLPAAFPTIIPKAVGLPHDVMIKFVVDMRNPVDFRTSQAITNLRDVWIKGGAVPLGAWQGNWTYDDTTAGTLIKLFDNGTNGDETAGDRFYSRDILWLAGTPGGTFEFKFAAGYPGVELGGAYYLDNEAGYGSNHSWAFPNPPPTSARLRMVFGVMGPVSVRDINGAIPENYSLSQNYPNPFNPTTKIDFSIPVSGLVTLKVYNILGQEVATLMNGEMKAGNYRVDFSTDNLSSGTYFYKLTAGSFTSVKKMLLLR